MRYERCDDQMFGSIFFFMKGEKTYRNKSLTCTGTVQAEPLYAVHLICPFFLVLVQVPGPVPLVQTGTWYHLKVPVHTNIGKDRCTTLSGVASTEQKINLCCVDTAFFYKRHFSLLYIICERI